MSDLRKRRGPSRRALVLAIVAAALVYLVGIFLWGGFMDP